jgi:hypothetical protein
MKLNPQMGQGQAGVPEDLNTLLQWVQHQTAANVRTQLAMEFAKILLPLRLNDRCAASIAQEAFEMADAMIKTEQKTAPKEKA